MPHDCSGNVVEVGQEVVVRFLVKSVSQNAEYCNCTLESIYPMPGVGGGSMLSVNTKQVEVVKKAGWRCSAGGVPEV